MRHPLTLAIVSSITAISFLWVLSLSHPDYHNKPNQVTARPAYFAYYNSLPGTAPVSAKNDKQFAENRLLDLLTKTRNSETRVYVRKGRRFPTVLAEHQINFDVMDSVLPQNLTGNREKSICSTLFETKKRTWIADLDWEVDPFWSPKKDRPTGQWARQLKVCDFHQPFGFFQNMVETQFLGFYEENKVETDNQKDLPPMPGSQKHVKTRNLKIESTQNFNYEIALIPNETKPESTLPKSNFSEDHQLENSLQTIDSVIKSIGYRKPAIASGHIPPIGLSISETNSRNNTDRKIENFCFGDLSDGLTTSDQMEISRQNLFWSECLATSVFEIHNQLTGFLENCSNSTNGIILECFFKLEDCLPAGTSCDEFFRTFFLPGNMEMARPLLLDPVDCYEYYQFRITDRLATAKKIPTKTSKVFDLIGGFNFLDFQADLAAGLNQLAFASGYTNKHIEKTIRSTIEGLTFPNGEIEEAETGSIPSIEMDLAGWKKDFFTPFRSAIPKPAVVQSPQRLKWLELATIQDRMFYQTKHFQSREIQNGDVWTSVRDAGKEIVANWKHLTAEYRNSVKFGGFFDSVQNRTKKRVVLEQNRPTRR